MNEVYLLLGSNMGNRQEWLHKGIHGVRHTCGQVVKESPLYETAAWGLEDQPDFLNQVIVIQTPLTPEELLAAVNEIERELGRSREVKWGQRTLDIDILFYNDATIQTETLTIPHPRLQERRFTLAPLNDIAPGKKHPVFHKTIATLLAECTDPLPVRKLKHTEE